MSVNKISRLALLASLLVSSASCVYAMNLEDDWKSRSIFIGSDKALFKLIAEQEKAETKSKGAVEKAIADVGLYTADLTDEEVWALIQAQEASTNDITDEEWALIRADQSVRNGYRIFQPKEEQKGRPREARPSDLGLGDFLRKLEENPKQMEAVWTKLIAKHEERRVPIIVEEAKEAEINAKNKAIEANAAQKEAEAAKDDAIKKATAIRKQAEAEVATKAAEIAKKEVEVAKKTLEVTQKAAEAAPAIKKLGPVVTPIVNKQILEDKKLEKAVVPPPIGMAKILSVTAHQIKTAAKKLVAPRVIKEVVSKPTTTKVVQRPVEKAVQKTTLNVASKKPTPPAVTGKKRTPTAVTRGKKRTPITVTRAKRPTSTVVTRGKKRTPTMVTRSKKRTPTMVTRSKNPTPRSNLVGKRNNLRRNKK